MTRPAGHRLPSVVPAALGACLLLAACGSGPATSLGAGRGATSGSGEGSGGSVGTVPATTASSVGSAGTGSTGTAVTGTGTVLTAPVVTDGGPTSTTGPAVTTTTGPPAPPPGTGAYGYVTAGPTCPVEQAGNPCPPKPVAASVSAQDGSGHTVAVTRTDSSGRYALSLAPGGYTLVADPGSSWPRCTPVQVTVTGGAPVRADISCDTGIR